MQSQQGESPSPVKPSREGASPQRVLVRAFQEGMAPEGGSKDANIANIPEPVCGMVTEELSAFQGVV